MLIIIIIELKCLFIIYGKVKLFIFNLDLTFSIDISIWIEYFIRCSVWTKREKKEERNEFKWKRDKKKNLFTLRSFQKCWSMLFSSLFFVVERWWKTKWMINLNCKIENKKQILLYSKSKINKKCICSLNQFLFEWYI